MKGKKRKTPRIKVRAENPTGACGYIDHMTIDELKERAVGDEFDGTCPACGMFHLTQEEIERLNSEKITETDQYLELKKQVERFYFFK